MSLELIGLTPWMLLALLGAGSLLRWPRLRRYRCAQEGPRVSVIVPARNEAGNISACLGALMSSSYTNREIIVVDDRSTDGTGDIVRALEARSEESIRLVEGEEVPQGWCGKPWACWQGYRAASGGVLLFTDADTRHETELLARTLSALEEEQVDLLTVLPEQTLLTFWERSVMPHMLFMLGVRYRASLVNRTRNPLHVVANGQYIMMPRASYEAIGGHEALKREVVEDLRLAQRVVESGRRLFVVHAEEFMQTRMYRSLSGIVEGWSKNVAIGSRYSVGGALRPFVTWLIVAFLLVAWVFPPAVMITDLFAPVSDRLVLWSLGATILSLAFWMLVNLRMRVPPLYSLIYPVGAVVAAVIVTRSAMRGRRVTWKGRNYRM
ncbi:MAG TPA: glycosyltransferase [Longimicrobiales bacterium]|nr:glycosyltransferase [Longimicrobiales bacterium]